MSRFTNKDIVSYYDQTHLHLRRGWNLDKSLSIHFGYHDTTTRNLAGALAKMNAVLAEMARISATDMVLDAGCGVGGSALQLARDRDCRVIGISLSAHQVQQAEAAAQRQGLADQVSFAVADYTQTPFEDGQFDVVWALESVIHAPDKGRFLREAARVLKPGGRLIIGDLFAKEGPMGVEESALIRRWLDPVAIDTIISYSEFQELLTGSGFGPADMQDITPHVYPSSRRQYYSSFIMRPLSALYRWYNPRVSSFADTHHQYMYYQHVTLRRELWRYLLVYAEKTDRS